VEQAGARGISLANVHFFWADERCVPPNHPDSNFNMAEELLFKPLKIVADKIHRLRGEDAPAVAVQGAIAEISRVAPLNENRQPVLDLILLGMGEDGHVASLFPNASEKIWDNSAPFLVIENSPKPPPTRLSLSFKAITAARKVWALVSGTGKEAAFHDAMSLEGSTPLGRVIRARQVKVFSDIH
jgi:6-phosphogluconolactonase